VISLLLFIVFDPFLNLFLALRVRSYIYVQ
jgi:hypothetical protein